MILKHKNRKLVIFQIISSIDLGGAERVAINIANSQYNDSVHYIIEVVRGDSSFSRSLKSELKNKKIKYFCSPIKNKKIAILLFSFWFVPIYLTYKPNIIHSHTEVPDISIWLFRKISWIFFWLKPRYVRTIHNTILWNHWNKIGQLVERYYIKHNCNISISSSVQQSYSNTYSAPKPPIIYNGIEEVQQKLFENLPKDKINILFAGRFEFEKGIDVLIDIVTALKDDSNFYFTIVGSGSYEHKLRDAFKNLSNVTIYSKIFGLNQYLASFDYLFMPSNYEGFALMSLEASIAHTPAIINRCAGLTETLPANWPLAVDNNSIEDFLKIFEYVKKEGIALQKNCGEIAFNYVKTNFEITIMQKKYEELVYHV